VVHAPSALLSSLSLGGSPHQSFPLDIAGRLSITDYATGRELARQLNTGDLVHAHGIRAAWICSIAQQFISFKLIVTLHNLPPRGLLGRLVLALISQRASHIICVSDSIAKSTASGKTVVIPNGVECVRITPDLEIIRKSIPVLGESKFVVLCASRLSHEKGLDILLGAANLLPDIQFIIAGDGPLELSLKTASPQNVLFLGQRDDIPALMKIADCVVVPSRSEGQGIAVLEAFAAGTAVAAAAVGGIPENLIDGVTGILVPPESPEALSKAIERLASNPILCAELSRAAGIWVRQNRSRQGQSQLIARLYESAAGRLPNPSKG
jgi:glycosyltransferase involved in cell wall biosynthesis